MIKNHETKFFSIYIKGKIFPLSIQLQDFKGEAMLFYSDDEENQYPCMDCYSKLFVIEPGVWELKIQP